MVELEKSELEVERIRTKKAGKKIFLMQDSAILVSAPLRREKKDLLGIGLGMGILQLTTMPQFSCERGWSARNI